MSNIKKLAGHTLWYGVPTILSRFLNYLLSLLLVGIFKPDAFGVITNIYAFIPFLNIIFTYGLETAFFRFGQVKDKQQVYNTLTVSLLFSTILFTLPLLFFSGSLAAWIEIPDHPEYIRLAAWIVFFDTLSLLPQSLLRQQERPRRFAFVRVSNIVANIFFTILFYLIAPRFEGHPLFGWYDPGMGVGYVLIANLLGSILTLLMLFPEWKQARLIFDKELWKEIMKYSLPLVVVGFGGMINEMLSRFIYIKVSPLPDAEKAHDLGVFGANYKLAVLITIFIQVFKMAAEPFFFAQSSKGDAASTYARVMKFFVMACCMMFLGVSLFLDIWKWLITYKNAEYGEGIYIVPILAMASVFLGIYYNLSIWYKLTNNNWIGARITLTGAVITIALNLWWIPEYGYTGSAWATFVCYAYMMVASYWMGQRHYPVPYELKKLTGYIVFAALLYSVHRFSASYLPNMLARVGLGVVLLSVFAAALSFSERKELAHLPVIGKWFGRL
ncbi:MAG: polysaccharide biosynthesis C-terminal domain-containing protein [Chitinophagaceae bacterium]|nr:polysaccharide biosynthesis C-terminal domain-containing protein [Chitinophagaceae bacterium]